tara:strand:+ start:53 stop:1213 length:1161 start_codon:yes stop_codon:yes gene_type:complete
MNITKRIKIILNNKLIFIFIISLAILSILYALKIANTYGTMDFPYSPTLLFMDKINPYEYFLFSKDTSRFIAAQYPVYAHATYILFSPFSYLEWNFAKATWSIINLFLGFLISYIFIKKAQINKIISLFIICIFCTSTPFRNCIGNGQLSFLILLCYSAYFLRNDNLKSFLMGISYIKYSFMPIVAFILFLKGGIKQLFISGIFCLIGWLIFSAYLNQNVLDTLFQPVLVALNGFDTTLARGDLYTLFNIIFKILEIENSYFIIFIIFFVTFIFSKHISKLSDSLLTINLMLIVSLFTFGHLIYDYVVLFPALVYSVKYLNFFRAKISILIILYFWFGIRIIEKIKMYVIESNIIIPTTYDVVINFSLLIVLYFLNFNIKSNSFIK